MTTATPAVTTTDIPHLDPPPAYRAHSTRSPGGLPQVVLPSGHTAVHLTRYADVHKVLTDATFARAETNVETGPSFLPTVMPPELLLNLDVPDHARMRGFVAADYSAAGVESLRPTVEAVIAERFTELRAAAAPDLFRTVLDPLPVTVNCRLLGIPASDIASFRPYARTVQMASAEDISHLLDHFWKVYGYVTDLVTGARPVQPGGLVDRFVTGRDSAEPPLSDEELTGLLLGSLLGADQNILSVLTKAVYALLCAPPLWRRLVDDPDLASRMTEELIRLMPLGTISAFPRVATRDVAVGDGVIGTGEVVYADAFAANRDPRAFPDPLTIDPDRAGKRHLQFGYGMHHCMGAALARMQIPLVLARLAQEFPGLALDAEPRSLPWDHGVLLRRPTALPVRW
ncbi:cytochrome P450 [Streptomyces sp. HNM0575]|uniref:cytochrome P450 n=1 Tax=Streptomyces sp. HNM0575 TaxID=2716338 RepID=UPI00145F9DD2|nr:cytochrome P450 [Streptomyces sp. HNM0575]NLU71994.1 cytochrome P450 [Streptomyces sp. HNM0575]